MTLTREQILALQPGPALDRLVAERVMGWRVTIGETSHPGRVIAWPLPDHSGICFEPSTDIVAAWEVFLVVMDRLFSVRKRFFDALAEQARTEAHGMPDGLWALQLLRHRFPHAVCLAALLATLENRP